MAFVMCRQPQPDFCHPSSLGYHCDRRPLLPLWYIFSNRDRVPDCKMMLSKNWRADGRSWRALLIGVAICSLTLSLATRFSIPVPAQMNALGSHVQVVKSVDNLSGEPNRQRLDRDSTRFAAPVVSCTCLEPPVLYLPAVPSEPLRSSDILSLIFYNRPPPASSVYFL